MELIVFAICVGFVGTLFTVTMLLNLKDSRLETAPEENLKDSEEKDLFGLGFNKDLEPLRQGSLECSDLEEKYGPICTAFETESNSSKPSTSNRVSLRDDFDIGGGVSESFSVSSRSSRSGSSSCYDSSSDSSSSSSNSSSSSSSSGD